MMASDCSSRSKEVCQICRQETSYGCLQCAKPVFNRSKSCSVAASEEEPGWKPRHAVSICIPCTNSKLKPCVDKRSAIPKGSVVSLSVVALLRYIYAVKTLHTNSTLEYKLPRPCCLLTCMIMSRALVLHVITR